MMRPASVQLKGNTLVFTGVLDRPAVQTLWPAATQALSGITQLDVSAVLSLDSAGLALLVALASRLRASGTEAVLVHGTPAGLTELCAAYRLTPALDYLPASSAV